MLPKMLLGDFKGEVSHSLPITSMLSKLLFPRLRGKGEL